MKTYYYYYRDSKRAPIITVCLIKDGYDIARGVTIRSPLDLLEKSEGRKYAKKYAKKALARKHLGIKASSGAINRPEVFAILLTALDPKGNSVMLTEDDHIFDFKSTFNPQLTEFEKKLLRKAR